MKSNAVSVICCISLLMGLCMFVTAGSFTGLAGAKDAEQAETLLLEYRIRQNLELILMSNFGEPPQLAFWLEYPETGTLQTVYVTHRSAAGDWVGKLECPACLPRWYSVYREEFEKDRLPWLGQPLPDGLSGATIKEEEIVLQTEIPKDTRVIAWIEVNMSADFNMDFPPPGVSSDFSDTDHDGQPSLIYRAEFKAKTGEIIEPEIWAYSRPGTNRGMVEHDLSPITNAREILTSLELHVLDHDG